MNNPCASINCPWICVSVPLNISKFAPKCLDPRDYPLSSTDHPKHNHDPSVDRIFYSIIIVVTFSCLFVMIGYYRISMQTRIREKAMLPNVVNDRWRIRRNVLLIPVEIPNNVNVFSISASIINGLRRKFRRILNSTFH